MAINNRYDFVMLFDVEMEIQTETRTQAMLPRVDAESGYGYVTDVCLKRKFGIM